MKQPYIEADCTLHFEGRAFTAGGSYITPKLAIGYMALDKSTGERIITNWHGIKLGHARITATWHTKSSYVTSVMHQVEAVINGVRYTGRCAGNQMIWRGKVVARKVQS